MSVTRAAVITHLALEFVDLAAETGQVVTDTAAGFGTALDRALRRMGVAETGLATASVEDADGPALFVLSEYYALLRFLRALSVRGDIDGTSVVGPRAQVFNHVLAMLADAAKQAEAFGYSITSVATNATLTTVEVQLGFLEATL